MCMFGLKGNPQASNLFAVIHYRAGGDTPASQGPEGSLGCCLAVIYWQFLRAISNTTEHGIFHGIDTYANLDCIENY